MRKIISNYFFITMLKNFFSKNVLPEPGIPTNSTTLLLLI